MAAEQSADQFRGQARLPAFAAPRRYDLRLTPDLAACTFSGSVDIALDVAAPTRFLVLNAADLDVSAADVRFTPHASDQVHRTPCCFLAPRARLLRWWPGPDLFV
jgi:puromycin-sensitive aminopeptidase